VVYLLNVVLHCAFMLYFCSNAENFESSIPLVYFDIVDVTFCFDKLLLMLAHFVIRM